MQALHLFVSSAEQFLSNINPTTQPSTQNGVASDVIRDDEQASVSRTFSACFELQLSCAHVRSVWRLQALYLLLECNYDADEALRQRHKLMEPASDGSKNGEA